MYVLGINLSHDRSTALVKDGKVLVAIAEERLDRIKHSLGKLYRTRDKLGPKVLPWLGISYCLQAQRIALDDLDLIMVDHAYGRVDLEGLRRQIPIKDLNKVQSIPHPSHHLAHAYSAYFCSDFNESAILVADHIGSHLSLYQKESESTFLARGLEIQRLSSHYSKGRDLEEGAESLANLYRLTTLLLGFASPQINFGQMGKWLAQYDEAGKTMGLAPYGAPRREWEEWITADAEGYPVYLKFVEWLREQGLLKTKNIPTGQEGEDLKLWSLELRDSKEEITQLHKDLAFKAQAEIEKGLLMWSQKLSEETRSNNLCLAGGLALNSVANKKILDQGLFKKIFIQPAATDDGNAIGAALYGYFKFLKGSQRVPLKNVYLGREYGSEEIQEALAQHSLHRAKKINDFNKLCEFTAKLLEQGKVVAWFQGRAEFGPRALGNRSILADPRRSDMKDHLNAKVKFRESFRPYAPAVLEEEVSDYFEFEGKSPFMLLVANIRREKQNQVPAVSHVDGTARLQTVSKEENPTFYQLIKKFQERTGLPILLNTSFNTRGHPIVESPTDALWNFFHSEIDYLVMGNFVLSRNLYADEELIHYLPEKLVRIEEDYHPETKFFLYDEREQEIRFLPSLDKAILENCDGTHFVEEILERNLGEGGLVLDRIREFIRRQWVRLLLPH